MRKREPRGYTLIELLGVMVIMAILAGIVMGVFGTAAKKGDISKAKSDIERIRIALDEFRAEFGYYPPSSGGYNGPFKDMVRNLSSLQQSVLTNAVEGLVWKDPWGGDYFYRRGERPEDRFKYSIWSKGPDGEHLENNPFDLNDRKNLDNISPSIEGY